ncbi:MAG: hypothetical protein FWF46_01690 [Oscillospiraceae bacterium]|nr:hypothetical protein [Oscillospiraceae bacterium]
MSKNTKLNFLRLVIIDVVTIIIVTVHFIITPTHRSYAVPVYIVLIIIGIVLTIAWNVLNRKNKD